MIVRPLLFEPFSVVLQRLHAAAPGITASSVRPETEVAPSSAPGSEGCSPAPLDERVEREAAQAETQAQAREPRA